MVKMLVLILSGSLLGAAALAQSDPAAPRDAASKAALAASTKSGAAPSAAHKVSPFHQQQLTEVARNYYLKAWGVDKMKVTYTASGNLVRFGYRVVDPERAKVLNDKESTPFLLGQKSHAMLHIPVMDKVGQLRQAMAPKAGEEYWMVFSNKGNLVRPGDRVNVIIGAFHVDNLMVE